MLGLVKGAAALGLLLAPAPAIGAPQPISSEESFPSALISLELPTNPVTDRLDFQFDVRDSSGPCGYANATINDQPLVETGSGTYTAHHGTVFTATWDSTCVSFGGVPQEQLLTLTVNSVATIPIEDVKISLRLRQVSPVAVSDLEGPATMTLFRDDPLGEDPKERSLFAEVEELDFLRMQAMELQRLIFLKERSLAESYGWSDRKGIRECDNLKCVVKSLYDKVSGWYTADITDFEDLFGSGGPGRHHGHHKPGRGGRHRGPHGPPGRHWPHPHHPHNGTNHTHPHPPPWRRPPHFPPPPWCRCPPPPKEPPPHGGPGAPPHRRPPPTDGEEPDFPDRPPHGGPPDGPPFDGPPFDGPPFDGPPFDGPPFDGPPHRGPPPHDAPGHRPPPPHHGDRPEKPEKPIDGEPGHGPDGPPHHHPGGHRPDRPDGRPSHPAHHRPPPPPPPHHRFTALPTAAKMGVSVILLVAILTLFHKRCCGSDRLRHIKLTLAERRARRKEARCKRLAERRRRIKAFLARVFFPFGRRELDDEEKAAAMLEEQREEFVTSARHRHHHHHEQGSRRYEAVATTDDDDEEPLDTTVEEELAGLRTAADVVSDMVAAAAATELRPHHHIVPLSPGAAFAEYVPLQRIGGGGCGGEDEVLPAYEAAADRSASSDAASSVVADGFMYTPGSSEYSGGGHSRSGSTGGAGIDDVLGDTKN